MRSLQVVLEGLFGTACGDVPEPVQRHDAWGRGAGVRAVLGACLHGRPLPRVPALGTPGRPTSPWRSDSAGGPQGPAF